jgi:hypothetical protein
LSFAGKFGDKTSDAGKSLGCSVVGHLIISGCHGREDGSRTYLSS